MDGHVFVTPEEDVRKCGVPGVSVTRSLFVTLLDAPVTLPGDRSPTPRTLGVSGTATPCPGS
jgi:hypothetical protein